MPCSAIGPNRDAVDHPWWRAIRIVGIVISIGYIILGGGGRKVRWTVMIGV